MSISRDLAYVSSSDTLAAFDIRSINKHHEASDELCRSSGGGAIALRTSELMLRNTLRDPPDSYETLDQCLSMPTPSAMTG